MKLLSSPDWQTMHRFLPRGALFFIWLGCLLILLGWPNTLQAAPNAAPLAQVGCSASMNVGNTAELNNAIGCYNSQTTAGLYAINFTTAITLDTSSTLISNATTGVTLQINGNGNALSGANTYRGLQINGNTHVTIEGLTIRDGKADMNGGGILNEGTLTLHNSLLVGNSASIGDGGGIYNTGTLTITLSMLGSNSAGSSGGGISNSGGTVTVSNSTLSGNSAPYGGGIQNFGTVTVSNSTLSGSSASSVGGGIYNSGPMTVSNGTLSGNSAASVGGGIFNSTGGTVTLNRSLIAGNSAGNGGGEIYNDSSNNGIVNANNYNLIGYSSNASTVDFTLGATDFTPNVALTAILNTTLADNGGDTKTYALVSGSPAIDAAGDSGLATDQRGIARPYGNADDIGAVEYVAPPVVCNFPATVSTTAELNNAIGCYNNQTTAGLYAINFNANITLTAASTLISNSTPGVALEINGNGNALSGANTYRGLEIATNTYVTIQVLTIRKGKANTDGGGILNNGTLTLNGSFLAGNSASNGDGGGIANYGTLDMTHSTLASNWADTGGGIANYGALNMLNSTLSKNSAEIGGGIYTIGTLSVNDSTLSENKARSGGGGLFNRGTLTISHSAVTKNSGDYYGGGIYNGGQLTVNQTEFIGNSSTDVNGGYGGGIDNSGTLNMLDSTLSGNSAFTDGGGINNEGTLTVSNSTLSDNSVTDSNGSSTGGGIRNAGTLTLTNSTLSDNSADTGGGIYLSGDGALTLNNTIIAHSPSGGDCVKVGADSTITGQTHNLIEDSANACGIANGANGSLIGQDPALAPLAYFDFFSSTETHALLPTSPAIDQGDAATCAAAPINDFDQNWVSRPQGVACDIGAVEYIPPTKHALNVNKAGSGSGTVTSTPNGIDCGATCLAIYDQDATVTLTATPDAGSTFAGWGGDCTGIGTCQVTMDALKDVTADFFQVNVTNLSLTVSKAGDGSGMVSSTPNGIACGATCTFDFTQGTLVSLIPTPAADSIFTGWTGCSFTIGTACEVTLDTAKSVTANFAKINVANPPLTVSKAGSGSGTIKSTPNGIDCGATCIFDFTQGVSVTLTATPDAGSSFAGWSGACSGTAATCTMTLDTAKSVTANFTKANVTKALTVSKAGNGSGTVKSTPSGIDCGATCTFAFTQGTPVTLLPTADAGSTFAGWSGCTLTTGTACEVTLDAVKSVVATFTKVNTTNPTLTVSKAGNGSGKVNSTPAGINCGITCSSPFTQGGAVTLTARPDAGFAFANWSGACSGTVITCTVTLDSAKTVTATFNKVDVTKPTLTVSKAGTGTGKVTSSPAGIDCGTTCSASFTQGAAVTLTAAPDAGSVFAGWSGACSGTATCQVTLSATKTVTATFNKANVTNPTLTVSKAGTGTGKVASSPAGIDCGATCSFAFTQGAAVTLTPTADAGSIFAGWSGACTGAGACQVTMDAAKNVVATFSTQATSQVSQLFLPLVRR